VVGLGDKIPNSASTLILLLGMSETEPFEELLNDEVSYEVLNNVRCTRFAELAKTSTGAPMTTALT
jgi:hypothetical protein